MRTGNGGTSFAEGGRPFSLSVFSKRLSGRDRGSGSAVLD